MSTAQIFGAARIVFLLLMVLICSRVILSQQGQYDRGTPPQHVAGVSELGSYTSADLGTVNLSNGALNLKLPLGNVGGRGFWLPLTLNWSSKIWSGRTDTETDQTGQTKTVAFAEFADGDQLMEIFSRVGYGWTVGVAPTLTVRIVRINQITSGPNVGCYTHTVPKLTLMLPDKGEIEFRDDAYDGAPLSSDCSGYVAASRGTRWHATDGSGLIFINDANNGVANFNMSGVVISADGMRYHFTGSLCDSITDRNGNKMTLAYSNGVTITDQLGRTTRIQQDVADPQNPGVMLAVLVTLPGFNGQSRYYKIKSGIMNQHYRSDINPTLPVITGDYDPLSYGYGWGSATRLFAHSYGLYAEQIDNRDVITELVLPDTRSLSFKYNQYGEVAEVQLPTGGKIWYDYANDNTLPAGNSPAWETAADLHTQVSTDRALKKRRTFADGTNLECTWDYSYAGTYTQITATSASGTLLLDQRHHFLPSGRYYYYPPSSSGAPDGTQNTLWSTGIEWRTETRNAAGVVIAATEQDWTQRAPLVWSTYPQEQLANDNRVNEERKILDNGSIAKVQTSYDQYNNPIEVKEYDYDQTLKRRTVTSYLSANNGFNYQTDDLIHLLSLPATQTIYDGSGNQVAQTATEYDVYTNDGNRDLLTNYASVSQHDSNYGIVKTTRGNPTRSGAWLNTTGSYIYTYPRYDILGNVVSAKDARGNVSTISFADDFGDGSNPGAPAQNPATPTYAFPTLITSPPPLPGAPVHTARSQYDYSTGLLTGFRDRNNVVTQTFYNDPFNRPTQVKSALGISGVESHSSMYYAPATVFGITLAKNDVLTATDLNTLDDASLRGWTITDGFGRATESWKRDPNGDVKVVTVYDALGRVKQTSNPFRPATETAAYTTTAYDLAGRVTSVITPDNAAVSTSYSGNSVTVTDQAGKVRKSVTDALDRLIEVYEDPNGLNYQTTYNYDVLDNLVKVTQGSQQRFFMYDSLKRLLRARNPEQGTLASLNLSDPITSNSAWSIGYQYDANGNLTQKTDARGVVSSYAYDALNRNTSVDYSDTSTINPDVKRFYDGAVNGKGRFWYNYAGGDASTGNNVEQTAIDSYDALGRPLVQRQLFKLNGTWSSTYQTSRAYNLAASVTSQTYPSGHTVNYSYDTVGRTSSFTGNLGDGVTRSYASSFIYDPRNQITQELFGTQTPLYHKLQYNIRGQLWDVRVSTGSDVNGSWNRGALQFFYESTYTHGASGPGNNGNVLKVSHYVPFDEQSSTSAINYQFFSYDSLNRISSVQDYFLSTSQPVGTQQSQQSYTYDRWGNRTINAAQTWGTGINAKQFTVDTATNRLGVPVGQTGTMSYDNAGNLTTDTYTGAGNRTYDPENRMTAAADFTGQTSRYTYDADGRRTRRQVASSQEEWQIYGMDGELLAEYRASAPASAPEKEYGYRNGQLLITATGRFNVALAANGAVATASSAHTCCGFSTGGAINGNNRGPWGNGEGWNDATPNSVPDWFQVDFAGSKMIDEIDVFSLHDNYTTENTPTETQTFTLYGLLAFDVQYWSGSSWVTIPGGSVTVNNKVWRKFTFSPITTSKIRVWINAVPDSWSRLVEIQAFGTSAGGEKVEWLVPDHLGTPRIIVDQTGSLAGVKRHDYLPFGEELFAGTGGRTIAQGYTGGDGVRQQFTSKERDIETGLDYFGARYFANNQGRFISIDPFAGSGRATMPQSWNKYSYVLNNPLVLVDPDGMEDQAAQQVVDISKDHVINKKIEEIKQAAKPLKPGEKPVPTSVVYIPGEQTELKNATVIGPDGEQLTPKPISGYMQPVGLAVLDQGGNIINAPDDMFVVETITADSPDAESEKKAGRLKTSSNDEKGQSSNGVFYDVQARGLSPSSGSLDIWTTQDLTVRQYFGPTIQDRKDIFKIQGIKIHMNDAQKRITITPGKPTKL
jgi:RHS repeat-associated protein